MPLMTAAAQCSTVVQASVPRPQLEIRASGIGKEQKLLEIVSKFLARLGYIQVQFRKINRVPRYWQQTKV